MRRWQHRVERRRGWVEGIDLPFAELRIAALHVGHEEIQKTVPVDISKIHSHGAKADMTHCQRSERLEIAPAVIDPDPVCGPEVVADIKVRAAVAVQITKTGCLSPVQGRGAELAAGLVPESALCPGERGEMATAVVQVKDVRVT